MFVFSDVVNLLGSAPGTALHFDVKCSGTSSSNTSHDKRAQRLVEASYNDMFASANVFLSHACFC